MTFPDGMYDYADIKRFLQTQTGMGLEWHPVNKSQIDSVRIWVTDGRNNILDLNRIDGALSIMIEVK